MATKNLKAKSNQLGIEKTSPLVSFAGEAIGAIITVDGNQDGSVTFLEVINKVQVLGFKAFSVLNGIDLKEIKAEIQDVDLQELDALIESFARSFDLRKDYVELLIEDWLRHLSDTAALVSRTMKLARKN